MNENRSTGRTLTSPQRANDAGGHYRGDVARVTLDAWSALSRTCEIWWTRSSGTPAIRARASERVSSLIEYARRRSPFYREVWHGLPPGNVRLSTLPAVTKGELMARFDDWVTDGRLHRDAIEAFLADRSHIGERYLDRYVIWKSSGSTGEPGIFVQDAATLSIYDALLNAQLQSAMLAGTYAVGLFTHAGRAALIAATGDHFASIASWQRAHQDNPWPDARAFSVMDAIPDLVAGLNEYQPAFLASYPTTLGILAAEQRAGRLRISPACIWSGGECLTSCVAGAIERAFGSVLLNEYGASECMSIAFSCAAGWLHVNADWVVLEPVDRRYRPTPPGEMSHTVLLTNLANRVQPIIRYDLGDSVLVNPASMRMRQPASGDEAGRSPGRCAGASCGRRHRGPALSARADHGGRGRDGLPSLSARADGARSYRRAIRHCGFEASAMPSSVRPPARSMRI